MQEPKTLIRKQLEAEIQANLSLLAASDDACISTLLSEAKNTFGGDEKAAIDWIFSPIYSLGWEQPISKATDTESLQVALDILGRIEYGVSS